MMYVVVRGLGRLLVVLGRVGHELQCNERLVGHSADMQWHAGGNEFIKQTKQNQINKINQQKYRLLLRDCSKVSRLHSAQLLLTLWW